MQQALSIGASGLSAYQDKLNAAGNNISNINTTGYKPEESTFRDLIYSKLYVTNPSNLLGGQGVKIADTGIDASARGADPTGRNLDLAINGDGWFAIETPSGTEYTRNGAFNLSVTDGNAYLVNSDGYYVLDANGQRISTPAISPVPNDNTQDNTDNTDDVDNVDNTDSGDNGDSGVSQSSGVSSSVEDTLIGRVGVFSIPVPDAMTPVSGCLFQVNSASGSATAQPDGGNIMSGYLEQSGASLQDEMVNLIMAQRSYQMSARVVQTADDIAQTINTLRT